MMSPATEDSSGHECPTCGRDDFESGPAVKRHHASVHGESIANREEKSFRCGWCGDTFLREVRPGESRVFCSQSCAAKQMHASRGNDLGKAAKKKARERDNNQCQRCGAEVSPRYKEGRDFEVHHLIPKAAGGPDALANLVTLCGRCHKEAHRGMRDLHQHRPDLLEELREVVCERD